MRWEKVNRKGILNHTTDFRLSRSSKHYKSNLDEIWWSALIELHSTSIGTFEALATPDFGKSFLIPNDYGAKDRASFHKEQFVTIFAQKRFLDILNKENNQFSVHALHLGHIIPKAHLTFDLPVEDSEQSLIEVPQGTVISVVIDDGIAFANNLFCDTQTSTRIEHVSILSTTPSYSKRKVTIGSAMDKDDIDRLIEDCTTNQLLDEEKFYSKVGLFNAHNFSFSSVALRKSHGTHVMALAAGYERTKAPSNRPILCALLPSNVTEDSTGHSTLPSLKLAIKRLQNEASRFRMPDGTKPPAVFNFSYGNFAGPHDGTSLVARLIEKYFSNTATDDSKMPIDQMFRVVMPAGNNNLSRTHASVSFDPERPAKPIVLDLMVLPDDRTASHVQMWMPYSKMQPLHDMVDLRVTVPNGPQSGRVSVSDETDQVLVDENGHELARLSFQFVKTKTMRGLFSLSINPTASLATSDLARIGQWKIEITPIKIEADRSISVWIERDETLPGFKPGGRQPYFDNADYVRFDALGAPLPVDPPKTDCPIRRAGTLNGFACGTSPLVVAAFTQSNYLLSDYSAAGPITATRNDKTATRLGPDTAARGDDSPVLIGVLSAGSRSGTLVRMNGTSVAAPRIAREAVHAISQGATGDRAWVWKASKSKYNRKDSVTRSGGGQVDVVVPWTII